ncbi:hypothetical protein RI367_003733 [Sorochytrium milnesiophthora]
MASTIEGSGGTTQDVAKSVQLDQREERMSLAEQASLGEPLPLDKLTAEVKDSAFYSNNNIAPELKSATETVKSADSRTLSTASGARSSNSASILSLTTGGPPLHQVVRLPPTVVLTPPVSVSRDHQAPRLLYCPVAQFKTGKPRKSNLKTSEAIEETIPTTQLDATHDGSQTPTASSSASSPPSSPRRSSLLSLVQSLSRRRSSTGTLSSAHTAKTTDHTRTVSFAYPAVTKVGRASRHYDRKPNPEDLFIRLVKGRVPLEEKDRIRREMVIFKRDEMSEALESIGNTNWNVPIG